MLHKNKTPKAKSEFTLDKLDEEYNPRLPNRNSLFASFKKSRYKTQVSFQQQQQICNNALNSVKKGGSIRIDWGTKSNFRVTKGKLQLPSLMQINQNGLNQIQKKTKYIKDVIKKKKINYQLKLKKLDQKKFQRKLKLFNINYPNQEENQRIFESKKINSNDNISSYSVDLSSTKLYKVQKKILESSKLQILQPELINKLEQIRLLYSKSYLQQNKVL